jgi:hypothetical protein
MAFKVLVAFWIVLGALIFGQNYWQSWVTARVAELPAQTDILPEPTQIVPSIDPDQFRRAINTPTAPMPGGWHR